MTANPSKDRITRLQLLLADENDAATRFRHELAAAWDEIGRLRHLIERKGFCADCGIPLDQPHCAPQR